MAAAAPTGSTEGLLRAALAQTQSEDAARKIAEAIACLDKFSSTATGGVPDSSDPVPRNALGFALRANSSRFVMMRPEKQCMKVSDSWVVYDSIAKLPPPLWPLPAWALAGSWRRQSRDWPRPTPVSHCISKHGSSPSISRIGHTRATRGPE